MAKIVYVNGTTGNNANTGLSPAVPKKTISGARSATAAATASTSGSPDIVLIAGGVYPEPNTLWNAGTDTNVVYIADGSGEVVVDFEQRPGTDFTGGGNFFNWMVTTPVVFVNMRFRNPYAGAFLTTRMLGINVRLHHCIFHQRNGPATSGTGVLSTSALPAIIENCSFYNLAIGIIPGNASTEIYSCYFHTTTTPISGTATRDYNAFPGNTETNGINTSTGANPGFRSVATEDFRLSPSVLADYQTFLTGGRFGGRIAAMGKPGIYYDSRYPQLRMITKSPVGTHAKLVLWENDPSYVSGGVLGTVVQDATTNELQIDLAAVPTATDSRARSDVIDQGTTGTIGLMNVCLSKFEDLPNGAALDTDTTLPRKYEYRASDTAFLKGDAGPLPGTSIDWTEFEQKDYLNLSSTYRYLQFRVTFRTDHTNA